MSMRRSLVHAAVALLLTASVTSAAWAQTARSGGSASAQLVQQMQQLASERTSLQAENARLKKELDDIRKERDQYKNAQKSVDARVKTSAAELAQSANQRQNLEAELKQTKDKTEQLIAKFRETLQTLREVETDRTTLKQTLATRDKDLKVCTDRNVALYQLNGEILTHMEHESTWSRLARAEPFTQIKRVQLENLADGYKARAKDQQLPPAPADSPAASPAPTSAQPTVSPQPSPPPITVPPATAAPTVTGAGQSSPPR
jgi:chromosome segregation ATPase